MPDGMVNGEVIFLPKNSLFKNLLLLNGAAFDMESFDIKYFWPEE